MCPEAFAKDGKNWKLDVSKPFFQEESMKRSKNYSQDDQDARPRAVWAEMFHGGSNAIIMEPFSLKEILQWICIRST